MVAAVRAALAPQYGTWVNFQNGLAGNIKGVAAVESKLTVAQAAPEPRFYTVKPGDTLSKIAKQFYNDVNRYQAIFEANKPMLTHPDKIYPGQALRIPELPAKNAAA